MKKRLLLIISIIIAAALLFSGWTFIRRSQKESAYSTVTLAKTSITDSVLASGTVLSSNSKEIYSELSNYTLKEVLVKTGDRVKAGDVLAILDTDTLESDIRQAELNISNAETTLKNDIATIETNLKNAENSVKSAKIDLENAQQDYNEAKDLYLSAASTLDELEQKEDLLDKAQLSYDNAVTSLNSSRSKTTAISKTNIELQKVALEKLKKNLNKTRITAPIDGTVTLCNAEAGKSSTGLLFIVEDTDHLIVSTSVGEYDINLLKLGQQVVIKSDSTGNMEFAGVISEIAPSAQRDASGNLSASNVLFDTEVTLNSNDSNMKIGMNVPVDHHTE